MEERQLFDKYQEGRHWENHPIVYAEKYLRFLKELGFYGLLVDVGCGSGRDVAFFHNNGLETIGIDYSEKEIELARKKYPECKFDVKDVEELDFADNSIGAYFMINVIHYVKKQKALDELLRTLKPNGYLFIHFNVEIIDINRNVDYQHDEKDIRQLISKYKIMEERIFERVDTVPKVHTHRILELILQKRAYQE